MRFATVARRGGGRRTVVHAVDETGSALCDGVSVRAEWCFESPDGEPYKGTTCGVCGSRLRKLRLKARLTLQESI